MHGNNNNFSCNYMRTDMYNRNYTIIVFEK